MNPSTVPYANKAGPIDLANLAKSSVTIKSFAEAAPCLINPTNPSQFWLEGVPHEGTSPFLSGGNLWKVFRNVKDYGAKGDGVTDDTAAIQNAINGENLANCSIYKLTGLYYQTEAVRTMMAVQRESQRWCTFHQERT